MNSAFIRAVETELEELIQKEHGDDYYSGEVPPDIVEWKKERLAKLFVQWLVSRKDI